VKTDGDWASVAEQIRQLRAKTITAYRTSIEHAAEMGRLLIEAKRIMGHGKFGAWVKNSCNMSVRTAEDYMAVARAVAGAPFHLSDLNPRPAAEVVLTGGIKEFLKQHRKSRSRFRSQTASPMATHTCSDEPARADRSTRQSDKSRSERRERDEPDDAPGTTANARGAAVKTPDGDGSRDAPDTAAVAPVEAAGKLAVKASVETQQKQPATPPACATSDGDEAWLASLRGRTRLKNTRNFDEQALLFRRCQLLLDQLRQLYEPSTGDLISACSNSRYLGRFSYAVAVPMGILPPEKWVPCAVQWHG
jgi:hypothetical protein